MILDCHIHIADGTAEPARLIERMAAAGVAGGILFSLRPPCFLHARLPSGSARKRLDNLAAWVEGQPTLYPFFWIDPIEKGADRQVQAAIRHGVRGFKVICDRYLPSDKRALETFRAIGETGKPILFHSGILWNDADSSRFNRPADFEALLPIAGLRFALAHISWPWCDEHLAVIGKIRSARNRRPQETAEMFTDLTPGTPPIYRQEALTKLFTIGYPVADNVMFGTDCRANDYGTDHARDWIKRDSRIFKALGLPRATVAKIHAGNLRRFVGIGDAAAGA